MEDMKKPQQAPRVLDTARVLDILNAKRAAASANARALAGHGASSYSQAQVHALTLVLRDLDLETPDGTQAKLVPTSPTWTYVQQFAEQMEEMLEVNRDKGNREGWMAATPLTLWRGANHNLLHLNDLLGGGEADVYEYDVAAIARRAANVANFVMMISDRCGALVHEEVPSTPGAEPTPKAPVEGSVLAHYREVFDYIVALGGAGLGGISPRSALDSLRDSALAGVRVAVERKAAREQLRDLGREHESLTARVKELEAALTLAHEGLQERAALRAKVAKLEAEAAALKRSE